MTTELSEILSFSMLLAAFVAEPFSHGLLMQTT